MITFQNIQKQFGSKVLYDNLSFSINPTHRIGCIGPNGAGKTVLLRLLAGEEQLDSGRIVLPSNIRLGYLPQEMDITQTTTPLYLVLEPFKHLFELESIMERLAESGDTESAEYQKAVQDYDALHTERAVYDADSLGARAKSILAGLGVPEDSWDQNVQELSGGYHMRVLLARLLLQEPDFLLLDEPTNHLDMDSLIWLEKYLGRYNGGMLIVSHDRDFLNRLITHTMEISGGALSQYKGTVDSFFAWQETHLMTEARRQKNLQGKIAQAEHFITRFKSKNTKASQAQSKMKQLEKLKQQLPEQRQSIKTVRFQLPQPLRSGSIPLQLENVSVSFGPTKVFTDFSLSVNRGDKIAIIGPNGAGKSTLLKTCFGLVKPDSGRVASGHNTRINYYSQHRLEQLNPDKTLYDTVAENAVKSDKTSIQSLLGSFLFSGDEVLKKAGVLSGGEKSRLSLAAMLANPGNVLLLDEPTNHLDIQSVERLADALSAFAGTVLIVSHDEYFLSRITSRILELRPGMYRDFPGTLTDYRSYIENGYIDSFTKEGEEATSGISHSKQERMQKRQKVKKLERAIQKIERNIVSLEQEMEEVKAILNNPENAHNHSQLTEAHNKIEEQQRQHDALMERWEKFQQRLERMSG